MNLKQTVAALREELLKDKKPDPIAEAVSEYDSRYRSEEDASVSLIENYDKRYRLDESGLEFLDAIKGAASEVPGMFGDAATAANKFGLDIAGAAKGLGSEVAGVVGDAASKVGAVAGKVSDTVGAHVGAAGLTGKEAAAAAGAAGLAVGAAAKGKDKVKPEQYYKQYGKCPRGYRRDQERGKCMAM